MWVRVWMNGCTHWWSEIWTDRYADTHTRKQTHREGGEAAHVTGIRHQPNFLFVTMVTREWRKQTNKQTDSQTRTTMETLAVTTWCKSWSSLREDDFCWSEDNFEVLADGQISLPSKRTPLPRERRSNVALYTTREKLQDDLEMKEMARLKNGCFSCERCIRTSK